jgi:succinate dehydrogenase/fumarate reductase flavoprotein subunit
MGGIACDVDCRTDAPGVLAAGECACVSVHGANRLGGNSLLEGVVFGRRAGRRAAAMDKKGKPPSAGAAQDEAARLRRLLEPTEGERPAAVRQEMEHAMRDAFGLFKDDAGMRKGRDRIRACRARLGGVFTHDKGRVFNHDLVHVLQLESMLDVALMCAEASIPRTESRGGHYRTDAPKLDNANWLKHTVIRRTDDGDVRLQYKPVTIEDIQPESEIKY